MTSYKWEPFDEDIKRLLDQNVISNPIEETEESVTQDDMEEWQLSEWVIRLRKKQAEADSEE